MISVVLAAYKGEKYIGAQVESIISQLGENDELIVSDDFPTGDTRKAIADLIENDKRIIYLNGPGRGVIANFEFAISKARGDYIFLSDQDDVWLDGKINTVLKEFCNGSDLVLHNAFITDGELHKTGETAFEINNTKKGFFRNGKSPSSLYYLSPFLKNLGRNQPTYARIIFVSAISYTAKSTFPIPRRMYTEYFPNSPNSVSTSGIRSR